MTRRQIRCMDMFVRVRNFGETHRDRFPDGSIGGHAVAAVASAVAALGEHARAQGSRAGSGASAHAQRRLDEQLVTMARTARAIGLASPGFDDRFRLPRRQARNAAALVNAGHAFLHHAAPVADRFIGHSMRPTFITELTERVRALEEARREREGARTGRAIAKTGIELAITSGRAAVATLDVSVGNGFHDDPLTLAAWADARRLGYRHRPPRPPRRAALPAAPVVTALPPAPVAFAPALQAFPDRLRLPAPRGVLAPATGAVEKPEQV
jgi:hypothetical protein